MKITKKIKMIGLTVVFACSASMIGNAQAVELNAEGIQRGNVTFLPRLDVTETYNDNIFLESTMETDSWVGEIAPGFGVAVEMGKHTLSAGYAGNYGVYHSSTDDNYDEHEFKAALNLDLNESFGMNVDARSKLGHDDRGASNSFVSPTPDEWTRNSIGTDVRVGLVDGNRIEADAQYISLEYTNNKQWTGVLERDDTELGASLFWNVMPKTALLVGIDYVDHDYDTANRDSDDIFYFAGLDWKATEKTDGNIKLGYKEKNFDQNGTQDWDAFAWDASITWRPVEHSEFLLSTGRSPAESTSVAALTVESDTSLQWTHEWMEDLFSTKVRANFGTSDYQGTNQTREDDRAGVNIGADYKFSRWGIVGVDYGYSERDSNAANSDYEQNLFMVTVRTAM